MRRFYILFFLLFLLISPLHSADLVIDSAEGIWVDTTLLDKNLSGVGDDIQKMLEAIDEFDFPDSPVDYNDLINKPTLFSGSYLDLTDTPELFSGSYNDLTDTPNLSAYITSLTASTPTNLTGFIKGNGSVLSADNSTYLTDIVNDTTPQLGGNLDLNQKSIQLSSSPTSDHTANGNIVTLTAGTALVFGDLCYMGSDGKMEKGDADAVATSFCWAMALATISENATGLFALAGSFIRDDTWNWTSIGQPVYLSTTTGGLSQTDPNTLGTDDVIQIIGIAVSADVIYFYPQLLQVIHA